MTTRPLLLLGAGGHAKVLLALARSAGLQVRGVCDPALAERHEREWNGVPVLGGDEVLERMDPAAADLILGVGQVVRQDARMQLYERLRQKGFAFPVLVHPAAWVAPSARLAAGVQIMAGAIVQPDCGIGENTIVNTRASVDHDSEVGRHVHVAPGATVCGGVRIGDHAFIASGCTVLQGLRVGDGAIVGAGTTLLQDLPAGACAVGSPTRVRGAQEVSRGGPQCR
jgi:sugar O-acyltransferase (sialic acid O-acetyltransferase NeuD family)